MRAAVLVLCLAASSTAFADTAKPKIANLYGFDWLVPARSKCARISGDLLRSLERSYVCKPRDADLGSASGKEIVVVCTRESTRRTRRSELLLLRSLADCKLERDTQLANGVDG